MASVHTELIRRHRRILRQKLKKLNEKNGTKYRLGQKNIDLLFYLNYVRFVKALASKARQIAVIEGSSEVMRQHWKESGDVILELFSEKNRLQ